MRSMNIYTVHINTKKANLPLAIDSVVILKEGFSFYACLLHFFWLAYKRIWIPAAVVFVAFALLGALERGAFISVEYSAMVQFGIMVYVGFSAYDWLRKSLELRGYTFAGVVTARDDIEAYQRFFDRYTRRSSHDVVLSGAVVTS